MILDPAGVGNRITVKKDEMLSRGLPDRLVDDAALSVAVVLL